MTAGDIDDRLGPKDELAQLRLRFVQLDTYLQHVASRPVLRAGIPFGAGISDDGQVIYIDSRLDTNVAGVDVELALSTHEQVEWALRKYANIGEDYATDPRGHRLANRAEYEMVSSLFPEMEPSEAWDLYDEHIDPQVRKIEGEDLRNVPYNLATYPYEDDEAMMKKIKDARNE
jgi:hypothetical protein